MSVAGPASPREAVLLFATSWLLACSGPLVETSADGARQLTGVVRSKSNGTLRVKVPVGSSDTSMLVTAQVAEPNRVHVRYLTDPEGNRVFLAEEWADNPLSKTNAAFIATTVTLNWPVLASDPGLVAGDWELELGVVDGERAFTKADVELDILLAADPEPFGGELHVSIIYTDGIETNAEVTQAVAEAQVIWQDLYDQAGINLSFEEFALDERGLDSPGLGDPRYIGIASQTPLRNVNVVLSEEVSIVSEDGKEPLLGIAGSIPGPLVPSERSAVQISTLLSAGSDGVFLGDETRTFAETMAHETGHFLGLFHPAEQETWDSWDILDDTPQCRNQDRCEDLLGTNLMFPFPICGPRGCDPQDELTEEQRAVMNRFTGLR